MAKIGYVRCSTDEQNPVSQIESMKAAGIELYEVEHMSGSRRDRPVLNALLESLQTGDVLVVYKLDRLSRSLKDLLEISDRLQKAGIGLKSLTQDVDTTSPLGRCFFSILGALAELELAQIRERTADGLAAARKAGKLTGRKRTIRPETVEAAKAMVASGQAKTTIAKALGLSRSRLYELLA